MKEYHKIETLFKREETGKHKLIEGVFRNSTIQYLKDLQWEFTEKVDGTNIRIYWDGHKVSYGGRTDNAQLRTDLTMLIERKVMGTPAEQFFEQLFGDKEVYIFCEGFGKGIQSGGEYSSFVDLMVYDIQVDGLWLDRPQMMDLALKLTLRVVPQLLIGTLQEAIDYVKKTEFSSIGTGKQPFEGVVGRPLFTLKDGYNERLIVKIKRKDFILN